GDVDDHEALVHVHLAGRKADARGGVHGLEHVVEQALGFLARQPRRIDRNCLGAQPGIGELEDGEQDHGLKMEASVTSAGTGPAELRNYTATGLRPAAIPALYWPGLRVGF